MPEQSCKQHVYHGDSAVGRQPGSAPATTRQPAAEFTADLKTEMWKSLCFPAFLHSTHSSGDSRTLPASRKLGRVKEA
jgi:hypothetical protein